MIVKNNMAALCVVPHSQISTYNGFISVASSTALNKQPYIFLQLSIHNTLPNMCLRITIIAGLKTTISSFNVAQCPNVPIRELYMSEE